MSNLYTIKMNMNILPKKKKKKNEYECGSEESNTSS